MTLYSDVMQSTMVFKSDKQRKKVMAMLKGGTKSAVNPQIIGRINPSSSKKIIIELVALKDFKEEFDSKDLTKAAKIASKIKDSKLIIINQFGATDSDALFVAKGISSSRLENLSERFPQGFLEEQSVRGTSKEIVSTLKISEKQFTESME